MKKDIIFFELNSMQDFIIGISLTPSLFLNYFKIDEKYVYFHMVTLKWDVDEFKKAFYYCILEEPIPYKWIAYNPRNFNFKYVEKPINNPNVYNISVVDVKNISFINKIRDFMNS
jgi:hypothetical protein